MPTHPVFIGIFYAMAGIALVGLTSFRNALHLVFPFAAGFALLGPFFAVGLYEMSRRREAGLPVSWRDAFAVFRSPALPSIIALGVGLFAVFAAWIGVADVLYGWLYGPKPPAAVLPFLADVLTTGRGWTLIVVGGLVGFCFAALALCLSVVSFPLMLDRDVGLVPAVVASLGTARDNPGRGRAVGADRRGGARPRLAAAVHRPRGRHAGPRPRDLAALSAGDRARPGARGSDRGANGRRPPRGAGLPVPLGLPGYAAISPPKTGIRASPEVGIDRSGRVGGWEIKRTGRAALLSTRTRFYPAT